MGRKKSGPSRLDLRRENEAVEARDAEAKEVVADEEEVEEPEAEDEGDGDDEDGKPKAKKKKKAVVKKAPAAKKPAAKRTRTPKEVRTKAVWVVFDNASKRVETFPFGQKKEAEELLARKIEEKKTTFYMNLIKDPLE